MSQTTGQTRDAGWELGVRRTVGLPLERTWEYLLGEGLPLWLGETTLGTSKGDRYETSEGTQGEIRSRSEQLRLRLTWQPADWSHESILQLTLRPAATGTTIAFHQERLADRAERKMMLTHWTGVLERMVSALS